MIHEQNYIRQVCLTNAESTGTAALEYHTFNNTDFIFKIQRYADAVSIDSLIIDNKSIKLNDIKSISFVLNDIKVFEMPIEIMKTTQIKNKNVMTNPIKTLDDIIEITIPYHLFDKESLKLISLRNYECEVIVTLNKKIHGPIMYIECKYIGCSGNRDNYQAQVEKIVAKKYMMDL